MKHSICIDGTRLIFFFFNGKKFILFFSLILTDDEGRICVKREIYLRWSVFTFLISILNNFLSLINNTEILQNFTYIYFESYLC